MVLSVDSSNARRMGASAVDSSNAAAMPGVEATATPPAVATFLRDLASTRDSAASCRQQLWTLQRDVLEEAHRALAGQPTRRAACRDLLLSATHATADARTADENLETSVNRLVRSALAAVRGANQRHASMDVRQRSLNLEAMRIEAREAVLTEERRFLEAEREGHDAKEARWGAERLQGSAARQAEWRATRSMVGQALSEMEHEAATARATEQETRRRLEAELAELKAAHAIAVAAERNGQARNEREGLARLQRARKAWEAERGAASACLANEVARAESEMGQLASALLDRNARLRERNRQLEADARAHVARLQEEHAATVRAMQEELDRGRRNLELALQAVPRGAARQLLYYESLKDPRADREASISWRGTKETLAGLALPYPDETHDGYRYG